MKFRFEIETWKQAEERRGRWTKWFAWKPVRCNKEDGSYEATVWLEYVERRSWWRRGYDESGWDFEYRTTSEAGAVRSQEMAEKNTALSLKPGDLAAKLGKKECGNCEVCKCPK